MLYPRPTRWDGHVRYLARLGQITVTSPGSRQNNPPNQGPNDDDDDDDDDDDGGGGDTNYNLLSNFYNSS